MPSFHWPRTSIHENMWNSKSWPEGDPYQKKGVMARNETTAITVTREMEVLGNAADAILLHARISLKINGGAIFVRGTGSTVGQSRWNRPPGTESAPETGCWLGPRFCFRA